MDTVMMLAIGFAVIVVLLVLSIVLSMRVQRIRLMKMGMQTKHDIVRIEKEVDDFRKTLPDLVDREKLAVEKAGLEREISALSKKLNDGERKFARLDKEMEKDKKEDKVILKSVSKLESGLEKIKNKLSPKKKVKPKIKAKPKPVKRKPVKKKKR